MSSDLFCRKALLALGWADDVRFCLDEGGFITEVRHGATPDGATVLAGPVIPGMPNLHSHGFQAAIRGLTGERSSQGDSFWSWREQMYAMAARIEPDSLADLMGALYCRMLESGYTGCGEFHYLHHAPDGQHYANVAELSESVLRGAMAAGMALTHLPVLYCRSGFGASDVLPEQRRFHHTVDGFLGLLEACRQHIDCQPLNRLGVAPHSLRAVPAAALSRLLDAVSDMPIHIHIAEQPLEVSDCEANLGARPLDWLLDHAPVGPDWCLVHATHITPEESRRAARSGAVAGLCPTTEADLGDGIFAATPWFEQGGAFGIGSDANLRLSPREELRWLEFTQRLASGQRNVLATDQASCGRFLYENAALGGARALAQPAGVLATGRRADLVELDHRHPLLTGIDGDAVLDSYLFGGGQDMIRSVWLAGECRISEGRHPDRERLLAAGDRAMVALRT